MTFRVRDVRYAPGETQGRHAHGELQISIIVRGALHEEVNGVAYRGGVGDVVIKPAGTRHANAFDAARIVCLDADPRALDRPLDEYAWHRGAHVNAAALRLAARALGGRDMTHEIEELFAALTPGSDRAVATRAARAIDEQYASGVSIDALASQLGIHRVHLARVFRAQWNCTPREYLQRARVRAAAERLASTSQPLADIALDAGFSDQSHMSRVFARGIGVTPAAFRKLMRG
jgi:AraC family transcriptional regulator